MTDLSPKILLSGASGLIGAHVVRALNQNRIQTVQLIRKEKDSPNSGDIRWDAKAEPPVENFRQLEGLEAAIHLSGANLSSHRWTESYKREIVSSRVDTTLALVRVFRALKQPPRALLCASATGIYGERGGQVLTEAADPGRGFLPETCVAWEAAADEAESLGMRVANLRFGVVITPEGGALKQMLPLFRAGAGGTLGNGRQWMSWIALPDLIRAILYVLRTETLAGAVNMVAPSPVTNANFTRALGQAVRRPTILPAPAFALRLAFGEMADEALLASTRAVPERLLKSGFHFELPDISPALKAVL
jgi:uncharacterized protein (TIGR01777 family)